MRRWLASWFVDLESLEADAFGSGFRAAWLNQERHVEYWRAQSAFHEAMVLDLLREWDSRREPR